MAYVHLVLVLALGEFLLFGLAVARARERYQVAAPATTGNEMFERYFRVQMNTLEQLVIFVPSLLLFARYVNAPVAAILGALFILGRALYFRGYVQQPAQRHAGFLIGGIPNFALFLGAPIGVSRALLPL